MSSAFSPRVAVIGGGLAGLAVARQLNLKSPRQTIDVEIFEASSRIGGVIESSHRDGFIREHAVNGVIGQEKGGVADLATDLGVEMIEASRLANKRWIFVDGELREVPVHPFALASSTLLSTHAKLRLLAEPLQSELRGEPTVAEFIRHRLGSEVLDRIVAPFVSGIYAGDTTELSMTAAFPTICSIAGHGSLLTGFLRQAFKGKRGRATARAKHRRSTRAPALGMAAVCSGIAAKLTGRIRLNEPIQYITKNSNGVDVVSADGRVDHFDAVVCAVPARVASTMLASADAELGELLSVTPSAAVAVVHLGFERRDIEHPLDGFGFLIAPSEASDVLGIVFESSIWPGRAPSGCELFRVMIGGRCRPLALEGSDEELIETATNSSQEILGIRAQPVHQHLVRLPHAIPQYTVGHCQRLERMEKLAADQGVVLAGASYHGVAANSISQDAIRVARRVYELLAAPLALAFFVGVLALFGSSSCSGTEKRAGESTQVKDSGQSLDDGHLSGRPLVSMTDGGERVVANPGAFAASYEGDLDSLDNLGRMTVHVSAIAPSPAAVTPRLIDGCTTHVRPELIVSSLGGVVGAFVWLEKVSRGTNQTTSKYAEVKWLRANDDVSCGFSPSHLVLGRIDGGIRVSSQLEDRTELVVDRIDDHKNGENKTERIAILPMTPVGRSFDVPLVQPGTYRVQATNGESAYVVVTDHPYVGVTNPSGDVTFTGLAPGAYTVMVWHPPVRGQAVSRRTTVTVKSGELSTVVVKL